NSASVHSRDRGFKARLQAQERERLRSSCRRRGRQFDDRWRFLLRPECEERFAVLLPGKGPVMGEQDVISGGVPELPRSLDAVAVGGVVEGAEAVAHPVFFPGRTPLALVIGDAESRQLLQFAESFAVVGRIRVGNQWPLPSRAPSQPCTGVGGNGHL